jgi:hypothetical protein
VNDYNNHRFNKQSNNFNELSPFYIMGDLRSCFTDERRIKFHTDVFFSGKSFDPSLIPTSTQILGFPPFIPQNSEELFFQSILSSGFIPQNRGVSGGNIPQLSPIPLPPPFSLPPLILSHL